jgi:hypothetical protein
MFLDFQACTNAVWDGKDLCSSAYRALRHRLEAAGLGGWIADYLSRIRELEMRRPPVGGDVETCHDVRAYREAVVRLSLGTITALALNGKSPDEGIRATYSDSDVAAMFRMAMHCQIIDDVLDYRRDVSAALPSFLTASASLPEAVDLTAIAARSYSTSGASSRPVFPLQAALSVVTLATKLALCAARSRAVLHGGVRDTARWPSR